MLAYHYAEAVRPEDVDLAWQGRDEEVNGCEAKRSPGRGERPTWLSAATRSTRAWPCCTERSSSRRIRAAGGDLATPSATPTRSSSTGRRSGRRWRARSGSAVHPRSVYTELALQAVRRSGCGSGGPAARPRRWWVERALELSPEGSPPTRGRLPPGRCGTRTKIAHAELRAEAERLGDYELRSHALAALTEWRGDPGISNRRAPRSRSVSSCSPRSRPRTIAISR